MSWPFEESAAHVTPERFIEHFCEREGLTREQVALPPILVATFQHASYDRLVEQSGADLPPALRRGPGGGTALSSSYLVGKSPNTATPVAVARFPVGAPATALTLEIGIARGIRAILVCGSAGSLQPHLPLGSTVIVDAAEREDGTSHHYLPAGKAVRADPGLIAALSDAARALGVDSVVGRAWTIDAAFRETEGAIRRHQATGVAVVEMEAAAIYAVAQVRGVRAAVIVAVSDELFRPWNPGFHVPAYVDALTRAADVTLLAAERLADRKE
jgi:nucleoside phosphorylase